LENSDIGFRELPGEQLQDAERVFRIACVNHREPPHHGQRKHRALQRVRVNGGHLRRHRSFEQNDRPMGTSCKRRRLGKEPSICKRGRKIRVRLPFDDDTVLNVVVTDSKTFHSNVEVSASPCETKQRGVSLSKVDAKQPWPRHVRDADTALGIPRNGGDVHHLEGKANGPQSGETINESCKLPRRLRASA
jgi:hypothetical protein